LENESTQLKGGNPSGEKRHRGVMIKKHMKSLNHIPPMLMSHALHDEEEQRAKVRLEPKGRQEEIT
jgi:hypothetical protein